MFDNDIAIPKVIHLKNYQRLHFDTIQRESDQRKGKQLVISNLFCTTKPRSAPCATSMLLIDSS
ncbi:hypothetical protein V1477_000607 [Vespula maculifrons]|uniref:Uncharacterized protein n=1 Tax=Vespula maculifrons TaxID=7453 RepID=A0ABD2D250_VESMC